MFFSDRKVFPDFMLTWKKNIFLSIKNVILSENSENLIGRSENLTAQIVQVKMR